VNWGIVRENKEVSDSLDNFIIFEFLDYFMISEEDILKEMKRQKKSRRMILNQLQGKLGELDVSNELIVRGYEVKRKHFGRDFDVRKVDPITGRKGETKMIEIKTGNAKTSRLQNKTKKESKKGGHEVIRSSLNI